MCTYYEANLKVDQIRHQLGQLYVPANDLPLSTTHRSKDPVLIVTGESDEYFGSVARWGLFPESMRYTPAPPITELCGVGLAKSRRYSPLLRFNRCLIQASAFYLSQAQGGAGEPRWKICHVAGHPLMIAGVYATRRQGGVTCAILTTKANDLIGPIQPLMPIIVDPAKYDAWLAYRYGASASEYEALLTPCSGDILRLELVSPSREFALEAA